MRAIGIAVESGFNQSAGAGGGNELVAKEFAGRKVINIAPNPDLARLNGSDKRMFQAMKVFRSMLVFGRVATAYVAALEA